MPVHLLPGGDSSNPERTATVDPRMTRRDLLRGIAAMGAAGYLGAVHAHACDRDETWALLSDVHMGSTADAKARGQTMAENLRTVVREILQTTPSPVGVVVDGDLALGKGEPADYATLLQVIEPLRSAKVPLHLTLGNHDHRDHFRQAFHLAPADSALREAKHASVVDRGDARWFFLDSLREVNETAGELTPPQRDWLARELDASPGRPSLLFVHHNLATTKSALADTEALLDLIRPRHQVKAVFFGHTHVWEVQQVDGIHMVNLPAVAYVFSAEQPLGWVRMALGSGGAELEFRALDSKHKVHGERHSLRWRT